MIRVIPLFLCAVLLVAFQLFAEDPVIHSPSLRGGSTVTVPALDQLAADWMDTQMLCNRPSVYNYWGGLKTTGNLTAFEFLTFPPYAQSGSSGEFAVDGEPLAATGSRWYPYQVVRRAVRDGMALESSIRLPFEQRGILCRVLIHNSDAVPRHLKTEASVPRQSTSLPGSRVEQLGEPASSR